ncbi:MAG: hypothetical protein LBV51_00845 [Acholeplasmatales bacterium]|jgi:hypothetical protein|nr:hypothetical protein [Acholeplasmatales bacterium]
MFKKLNFVALLLILLVPFVSCNKKEENVKGREKINFSSAFTMQKY